MRSVSSSNLINQSHFHSATSVQSQYIISHLTSPARTRQAHVFVCRFAGLQIYRFVELRVMIVSYAYAPHNHTAHAYTDSNYTAHTYTTHTYTYTTHEHAYTAHNYTSPNQNKLY